MIKLFTMNLKSSRQGFKLVEVYSCTQSGPVVWGSEASREWKLGFRHLEFLGSINFEKNRFLGNHTFSNLNNGLNETQMNKSFRIDVEKLPFHELKIRNCLLL